MKTALITGITGQDGSYLAELLLSKHYHVVGLVRSSSSGNTARIDPLLNSPHAARLRLVHGDLSDASVLTSVLHEVRPDEVYNLAAQSQVRVSFDLPEYTGQVTALGAIRLLEAIRRLGLSTRFYQASSSELFGKAREVPQTETTPFHPRSPYAVAKAYAYYATQNYREAYGMFAVNGILFNHESPRRGEAFVSRKITRAATRIKLGLQDKLYLGNLEAERDWGYAPDYVEAMWMMLQTDEPEDFVIATGESHSVRGFLEKAFSLVELDYRDYVLHDSRFERPAEVELMRGSAVKAYNKLGWRPKVTFEALVKLMVEADLQLAQQEFTLLGK